MSAIDIDHLRDWIGREEAAEDVVTPGLVARFRATFGNRLAPGEDAPLGLHWCLAPPSAPPGALGEDGHPARGGFVPPVPLPSRIWAGGEVAFRHPLQPGDTVHRASRIAGVEAKTGRSGPLVFVSIEHRLHAAGRPVVEERQDIVYRAATGPPPAAPGGPATPRAPGAFVADPVMLFRYSALTFNGHRIHYDHPYAVDVEGHGGLVVHGPLQATILMHAAAGVAGTRRLRFAYRGEALLLAGEGAAVECGEASAVLRRTDGVVTCSASFAPIRDGT